MKKKKKPTRVRVRRLWTIKPTTKVKDSSKRYARPRAKEALRKELEKDA